MKYGTSTRVWFGLCLTLAVLGLGYCFFQSGIATATSTSNALDAQLRANSNGTVSVIFRGTPGQAYAIEFSTTPDDSESWITIGGVIALSGWTEWIHTNSVAVDRWFYQVVPQTLVDAQEAVDSARLLAALNQGDYQTVIAILRKYGIAEETLQAMAGRLGQSPSVQLGETFLKGTSSLSLSGRTDDVQSRLNLANNLGYGRAIWVARRLDSNWLQRCDSEIAYCSQKPVGAFDAALNDPHFIRFFKWYDRYAERLHSICLNWEEFNNHDESEQLEEGNRLLSGLFKLIKARKPTAFVWVQVVKQDVNADVAWLKTLNFRPDGLFIANLRQFHSPFMATRKKYQAAVGNEMPMIVVGFYGYRTQLQAAGKTLSSAKRIENSDQRQLSKAQAMVKIAALGRLIGPQLEGEEKKLRELGYKGLFVNWRLVEAVKAGQQ